MAGNEPINFQGKIAADKNISTNLNMLKSDILSIQPDSTEGKSTDDQCSCPDSNHNRILVRVKRRRSQSSAEALLLITGVSSSKRRKEGIC